MGVVCNCSTGGGNTGTPSCYGVFDVTVQAILCEYYKEDGSINGIEISTLASGGTILDQAFLDSKIKDNNARERYYPTPALKNVTDERSEDITEEFEDATSIFIQEGSRTFTGLIIKGDPVLIGALKSWRCVTMGVFFIDKSGNLIGNGSVEGWLNPILVENDSFSVNLVKGTDTTKQKATISLTISSLESDEDLRMIEAVSITAQLKGSRGLVDVVAGTPTNVTTTGFDVQLNTLYGGLTTPIPAEGLELTDFQMNEVSPTPSPVVISSVTESTTVAGLYTFVFPAETTGDVLEVSNTATDPLPKGFDLAKFNVTIP